MFKKLKELGSAYAGHMKTALDPERIRQEMAKADELKYAMPNASPERLPELVGLVPGPPMAVADAAARRQQTVASFMAPAISARTTPSATLDRVYTRRPRADEIVTILSRTALDGRSVLGVYPSTDLLHPARFGDGDIGWEWCVVHTGGSAASADLAAAAAVPETERPSGPIVECTELARGERWIDRSRTDPILFDEEAAAIVAVQSGVDPAQCLGMHRMLDWGRFGMDPNRMVGVMPIGARILRRRFVTPPGPAAAPTAPMAALGEHAVGYADGDPLPVHMDLIDWTAISLAVQPRWTAPVQGVTTYPQLPATAEELLLQYLSIVGLDPADTFGVSTTVFEQQSAFLPPGAESAQRGASASMLAIVYRDRPAYVEGRARFEQYRAQHLQVPLGIERPVVGRAMKLAMAGMKWHVRSSVGDAALYEEIGGDDSVDGDLYPYIIGPPPHR